MNLLVRTLEALIYPVGFVWLCLSCGAFYFLRKRRFRAGTFCAVLSGLLYLTGATPFPEYLMGRLERPFAGATAQAAPQADAILVLGGILNASARDSFGFSLNAASDRAITGVELARLKKAPVLLISGGISELNGQPISEGDMVKRWLTAWNVAPGEIIGLSACVNTHEESLRLRGLMQERGWKRVLLVTSAFHMPRALATFKSKGIDVHPVACDFEALPVLEGEGGKYRLVPIIDHIKNFTLYLHEAVGWHYYKLRGWL